MAQLQWSFYEQVALCQAAIKRIREELRAGQSDSAQVEADLTFILGVAKPRFQRRAAALKTIAEDAVDEAVEEMIFQLIQDIYNRNYPSIESYFGKYLGHMATDILMEVQRNYGRPNAFSFVESLDATVNDEGVSLHEHIEDPRAEAARDDLVQRADLAQAIQHLPGPDRQVIEMRLQGMENKAVAQKLGMSAPNATHIYNRAVERLHRMLNPSEEY